MENKIQLFEKQQVRVVWTKKKELVTICNQLGDNLSPS